MGRHPEGKVSKAIMKGEFLAWKWEVWGRMRITSMEIGIHMLMETYKQLGIKIQRRQAVVEGGTAEVDRDQIGKGPEMCCQGLGLHPDSSEELTKSFK